VVLQGASLTVPAYALTPGKVYSIACRLTILTRETTVVRVVTVRSAAPQAVILGGDRTIAIANSANSTQQASVCVASAMVLDASSSRNRDFPATDSRAATGLQYDWSCSYRASAIQEGLSPCSGGFYTVDGPRVTINPALLPPEGRIYKFAVVVSAKRYTCVATSPPAACPVLFDAATATAAVQITATQQAVLNPKPKTQMVDRPRAMGV